MRLVPFKKQRSELLPSISLFDDFIDKFFSDDIVGDYRLMAVDVIETDNDFIIKANLPGIKKEQINLSIKENQLLLEAKTETTEEKTTGSIIRKERYVGSYQRIISLPDNCDSQNIKAKMENGVLNLTIPKKEPTAKREIVIE